MALEDIARIAGARAAALVVFDGDSFFAGPSNLFCPGRPCPMRGGPAHGPCPMRSSGPGTRACAPIRVGGAIVGALRLDERDGAVSRQARARAVSRARSLIARTRSADTLKVRVLGRFELRLAGSGRDLSSELRGKARELLVLLLLAEGRSVSRDSLVRRLWPGAREVAKAGANRLHGLVHAIRDLIEPFRDERRWLYVRRADEGYFFDTSSPHAVDVLEFLALARRGFASARRGHVDEAASSLEDALRLAARPLLDGDPGTWDAERNELDAMRVDVLAALATIDRDRGNTETAVERLRRALAVAPLREDLHQDLIRSFVELGRRADARAQYRECERLLRSELGIAPLPGTRLLAGLVVGRARSY